MSKFEVGDRVIVASTDGYEHLAVANAIFRGRKGEVSSITPEDTYPYPYGVVFGGGDRLNFAENELEPDTDFSSAPEVAMSEVVSPAHYSSHPSGVECIDIVKHMTFPLGNAIKYIWRSGLKSPDAVIDLEKAKRYIEIEIERIQESK
ncbi:DUF3310 domain-containing protein [Streptomyces sp. NPDC058861]|uniref:DUF3310 domain-containing protein n=1 Tax=Streptomyces sp. NPDC058861 TaxID=3346653 RepID=UPI00368252E4